MLQRLSNVKEGQRNNVNGKLRSSAEVLKGIELKSVTIVKLS